jgi:hypothetical protein
VLSVVLCAGGGGDTAVSLPRYKELKYVCLLVRYRVKILVSVGKVSC